MPGALVHGRYRIAERLGGGGMGEVFKAEDRLLRRPVAIKRLHPHLAASGDLVARAEREGQILATLRHPNIIDVYDMFTDDDGALTLVLEFVAGRSLEAELADRGRLEWRRCAEIGVQVCGALAAAHGAGVIHRDIKPGNILLREDGTALVADFGIARLSTATIATLEGTMIGTPDYWAPEQATPGEEITPRSDLYSLCCVLFEAVCGRPPFRASPDALPAAVFVMHVVQPVPDPRDLLPGIPDDARTILLKGLSKSPADRQDSAEVLESALASSAALDLPAHRPAAGGGGRPARSPRAVPTTRVVSRGPTLDDSAGTAGAGPARRRRRTAFVAAGVAAAGLTGILAGFTTASSGGGGAEPAPVDTEAVSSGVISAEMPSDWAVARATGDLPLARAFGMTGAVTASAPGDARSASVVMGTARPRGPGLLAEGVVGGRREVVRLGKTSALRYPDARAGGRRAIAYVVPTDRGAATLVCAGAPDSTAARTCGPIASTMRIEGARVFPLTPGSGTTRALAGVLGRVNTAHGRAEALAAAGTAEAQETEARAVASGLASAIRAIPRRGSVSPGALPALDRLRRALRDEADAFSRLGSAAAGRDSDAWTSARERAQSAQRRVAAAAAGLDALDLGASGSG